MHELHIFSINCIFGGQRRQWLDGYNLCLDIYIVTIIQYVIKKQTNMRPVTQSVPNNF